MKTLRLLAHKLILVVLFLGATFVGHSQIKVTRGPYLQKATQSSIIIRWSTDSLCDSKVNFGGSKWGLNSSVVKADSTTDHSIEITGLDTNKVYFYSVGTEAGILAGATERHYFETLPAKGSVDDYTFIALGDAGTGFQGQKDVKNALLNYSGNHYDGVLLLGDNAYQSGTQLEYQNKFFDSIYYEIFENTVIWPAPGNHDYYGASIPLTPTAPYFDIFDCPTEGECGGVPSGLEQYYSFDYGNVHFISLDSYGVSRMHDAKMAKWLREDLASDSLLWTVVYWHHPPYSKGSHDSDNATGNDGHMVQMREQIVPILEEFGVDLVLNGHSHSYERTYLINGHYGESSTLSEENMIDTTSGSYPIDCPYFKYSYDDYNSLGTIYNVVGVSGQVSFVQTDWPHPAMYSYFKDVYGALVLNVDDFKLTAEFLTAEGDIYDTYTIMKNIAFTESGFNCVPLETEGWVLFPNPAVNEINLYNSSFLETGFEKIGLYDFTGRLIELRDDVKQSNVFDISGLAEGTYFVRMQLGSLTRLFRFVKV